MHPVDNGFHVGVLDLCGTAAGEVVSEGQEVLNPDHLHPALCKGGIVLDGLLFAALLGVGTGRGLDHAVVQRQPAELPGAEHRGEIGIRIAEVIVLRIQFGHDLIDVDRCFLGLCVVGQRRRRAQNRGRRKAESARRGSLQKVSA